MEALGAPRRGDPVAEIRGAYADEALNVVTTAAGALSLAAAGVAASPARGSPSWPAGEPCAAPGRRRASRRWRWSPCRPARSSRPCGPAPDLDGGAGAYVGALVALAVAGAAALAAARA
jgi:hypothetical protein